MSGLHREQSQRVKLSPSNDDHRLLHPDHTPNASIGSEVRDLAGTSRHCDDMLWVPEDSKMNVREQGGEYVRERQREEVKQEPLDVNVHQGSASAAMDTDSEDGDWLPRSKKKAEKRRMVQEKKERLKAAKVVANGGKTSKKARKRERKKLAAYQAELDQFLRRSMSPLPAHPDTTASSAQIPQTASGSAFSSSDPARPRAGPSCQTRGAKGGKKKHTATVPRPIGEGMQGSVAGVHAENAQEDVDGLPGDVASWKELRRRIKIDFATGSYGRTVPHANQLAVLRCYVNLLVKGHRPGPASRQVASAWAEDTESEPAFAQHVRILAQFYQAFQRLPTWEDSLPGTPESNLALFFAEL